ncbi:MAG TPA: DUF2284 domain-containing protein [Candidatus Methanofastidiosa archaeon]|nr:DUF2284 domain-containing protein [Candidatus Methanofastidiosa archaeon]
MISDDDLQSLEKRAKELGAKDCWPIPASSIVVENRTVLKCIFGCNGYGSQVCPPYIPTVDEFRKMLSEYEVALLVEWNSKNIITKDISENFVRYRKETPDDPRTKRIFDNVIKVLIQERHDIIQPGVLELEKLAWTRGHNMALATFSGMCAWCANKEYTGVDCMKGKGPCRNPNVRRPCLMGLGVRMDKTLEGLDMPFKRFPLDNCVPSQYTLILLD